MRRGIIVLALFFAGLGFLQIKQSSIKKLPTPGDSNELFCCYSGVVREGESLYLSFSRLGIPQKIWATVFEKVKGIIEFNRIKPGEEYLLKVSKNGELVYYEHRRSEWETVKIERDSIGIFSICRDTVVFTKVIRCYSGRIKTTLWDAMVSDSIPPGLIDNLIRVFAYNIDFATETRLGDEFSVLYEEDRYDGKAARVGSILAAQYKGKFGTYRAYKYQLPGAGQLYYDEQGRSLKRALLRTPVAFVRISSRFSYSRLHPILGIRRPHLGVDYAAPFGTPVIAAGSGVVTYAGWNGGFGNFVSIQHTGGLTTTYGHLSRIASGIRKGSRVREGQVIGYVGSTGLATGPHLDYRILRNGKFVDPLRITAIPGPPIPKSHIESFKKRKAEYLNLLEALTSSENKNAIFN